MDTIVDLEDILYDYITVESLMRACVRLNQNAGLGDYIGESEKQEDMVDILNAIMGDQKKCTLSEIDLENFAYTMLGKIQAYDKAYIGYEISKIETGIKELKNSFTSFIITGLVYKIRTKGSKVSFKISDMLLIDFFLNDIKSPWRNSLKPAKDFKTSNLFADLRQYAVMVSEKMRFGEDFIIDKSAVSYINNNIEKRNEKVMALIEQYTEKLKTENYNNADIERIQKLVKNVLLEEKDIPYHDMELSEKIIDSFVPDGDIHKKELVKELGELKDSQTWKWRLEPFYYNANTYHTLSNKNYQLEHNFKVIVNLHDFLVKLIENVDKKISPNSGKVTFDMLFSLPKKEGDELNYIRVKAKKILSTTIESLFETLDERSLTILYEILKENIVNAKVEAFVEKRQTLIKKDALDNIKGLIDKMDEESIYKLYASLNTDKANTEEGLLGDNLTRKKPNN